MSYLKKLYYLLSRKEILFLLSYTMMLILFAIYAGFAPYVMKIIIDYGVDGNIQNLLLFSITFLIVTIIMFVTNYYFNLKCYGIILKLTNNIKSTFVDRIRSGSLCDLNTYTTGEFITRFKNETENSVNFLYNFFNTNIINSIKLPIMIILCIRINWQLTLGMLLTTPTVMILTSILSKKLAIYNREKQITISNITTTLKENLTGKIYLRFYPHKYITDKYNKQLERYYAISMQLKKKNLQIQELTLTGLTQFISILIVCIASYMVSKDIMTVGSIMAFFVYVFNMWEPIGSILSAKAQYRQMKSSMERVQEIMDINEEQGEIILQKQIMDITLKNVKYNIKQTKVLRNISLIIKKGEKIAIVGASGSGKTTLLNIIAGLYNVTSGTMLVNNQDIQEMNKDQYRARFSYISSEPFYFNDTIYNNLYIKSYENHKEEINNLIEELELQNRHIDVENTRIIEGGDDFSSGEKVRLDILRNILKKPEIVVIDEPFARLDRNSIVIVNNIIATKFQEKTVIITTHIIEPIKDYDNIYVIMDGEIVASGTHNELIQTCATYKKLYESKE